MSEKNNKNDLWQKVCKAHEKLNEEKYPEMMLYLNLFLVRDQINQDYMDLANNLMNADAGKEYWSQVHKWGTDRKLLTSMESDIIRLIINMDVTGRIPTEKQAKVAVKARKKLIDTGMPLQF